MQHHQPIVLFDGVCKLCNRSVDFILKHDKKKQFRFLALQDEKAKIWLERSKIIGDVDSVVLVDGDLIYAESEALLRISALLGFPWNIVIVFRVIPEKLRNLIYRWIARNRYRWFGTRKSCRIME